MPGPLQALNFFGTVLGGLIALAAEQEKIRRLEEQSKPGKQPGSLKPGQPFALEPLADVLPTPESQGAFRQLLETTPSGAILGQELVNQIENQRLLENELLRIRDEFANAPTSKLIAGLQDELEAGPEVISQEAFNRRLNAVIAGSNEAIRQRQEQLQRDALARGVDPGARLARETDLNIEAARRNLVSQADLENQRDIANRQERARIENLIAGIAPFAEQRQLGLETAIAQAGQLPSLSNIFNLGLSQTVARQQAQQQELANLVNIFTALGNSASEQLLQRQSLRAVKEANKTGFGEVAGGIGSILEGAGNLFSPIPLPFPKPPVPAKPAG